MVDPVPAVVLAVEKALHDPGVCSFASAGLSFYTTTPSPAPSLPPSLYLSLFFFFLESSRSGDDEIYLPMI